ncbi:MAG: SpoIIE family protein phosphatase [bacterium]|nr:SpoIIE family protein phosphatase [bacterium]
MLRNYKLKNLPISIAFLIGISIIILCLSLLLASSSFTAIKTLGNYSNRVTKKYILKNTSEILQEKNIDIMQDIELILNEIKNDAHLLAKQTEYYLKNYKYYKKPDKYSVNIFSNIIRKGKYHLNPYNENISVCYWGNTTKIPEDISNQMRAISYITSLIYNITKVNIYTEDIWVNILKDKYMVVAPNFTKDVELISYNEFAQYFQGVYDHYSKFYSAHPDKRNKVIWIGYKKQLFKHRRDISVMYPIFDNNNSFIGFTGVDVEAKKLAQKTLAQKTGNSYKDNLLGRSFLIMHDSTLISCPESIYKLFSLPNKNKKDMLFFQTNYSVKLIESTDENVRNIGRFITKTNKNGVTEVTLKNKKYLLAFSKAHTNRWTIGTIMSIEEVMEPVYLTKDKTNHLILSLQTHYIWIILIFIILAIIVSLLFFSALINVPIKKLKLAAKKIGNGKFNTPIKLKALGEINDLSESIKDMGKELVLYTKNLEQEVKNRNIIETELKIAGELQNSILPKITDEFISEDFEIYAKLLPAKNMSGDFYDFFYLSDNILGLVLADVSGKGITAAFYMSMAKAIIKNVCFSASITDPGSALEEANKILCKNNESCMFLTMYLVFYNIKSGELTYANAGHHEYILATCDNKITASGILNNSLVGINNDANYKTVKTNLESGDTFALFTDGIIEAPDENNIEYGLDKVIQHFSKINIIELNHLGDTLISDVLNYQSGNRFDDITLLMLKRNI